MRSLICALLPGTDWKRCAASLPVYTALRVNDQWRIVFRWRGTDAEEVRIVDYHKG